MYDDRYHFHLGYYDNGYDIEAIALKRKLDDIWDIFFNFDHYGFKNFNQSLDSDTGVFGTRIFSIYSKDLSYDIGVKKFEEWLTIHKVI